MLSKSLGDDKKRQKQDQQWTNKCTEIINLLKNIRSLKRGKLSGSTEIPYHCEVLPELRGHGQREAKKLPRAQILWWKGCFPDPSLNRAVEEQKELILHTWKLKAPVLHESMGQVKNHLLSCCYIGRLLTILNISNNVNSERSGNLYTWSIW